MKIFSNHNHQAFTFMEIVAVMLIVSALAVLALARAPTAMYRIRNQEAEQLLLAIYVSQVEYEKDNGSYTTNMADLDISINTADIKNFNTLNLYNAGNINCSGPQDQRLASLVANMGGYTLSILDTGEVVCTPCGGVCQKMGFRTF